MLLVQCGHVRGAHRAVEFFSAFAHAAAHLDRGRKASLGAKVQHRVRLPGFVRRPDPQGLGHRRRVDDLPRIHQILRVESPFDLAESVVKNRPVEFLVEVAASQAVAMLSRKRPVKLQDQI